MKYPTPTPQALFDDVAKHLFTQGAPARSKAGACLYVDEKHGRECAIGHLIPTQFRSKMFDQEGFDGNAVVTHLFEKGIIDLRPSDALLYDLQAVHDDANNWDYPPDPAPDGSDGPTFNRGALANALRKVARTHSLSTTAVDAIEPPETA